MSWLVTGAGAGGGAAVCGVEGMRVTGLYMDMAGREDPEDRNLRSRPLHYSLSW